VAKHSEEVSIYFDFSAETSSLGGLDVKQHLEIEFGVGFLCAHPKQYI